MKRQLAVESSTHRRAAQLAATRAEKAANAVVAHALEEAAKVEEAVRRATERVEGATGPAGPTISVSDEDVDAITAARAEACSVGERATLGCHSAHAGQRL